MSIYENYDSIVVQLNRRDSSTEVLTYRLNEICIDGVNGMARLLTDMITTGIITGYSIRYVNLND